MSFISRRSFLASTVASPFALRVAYARDRYERGRRLVSRVQEDLRQAASFAVESGKEGERYENAQRHLSEFDRELSRDHFDKDRLDTAIDDVKNVVEHNTLPPEARDVLTRDLQELRDLRAERGRGY